MALASCAVDGYDDETFSGGVTGQTLSSPAADSIVFTANADGTKTTISWPVVYGAGGYCCSVLNVSDESHPVVVVGDTVVDGTTLVVPRTEDVNYSFSIRTVGNEELGNSDAAETTTAFFRPISPDTPQYPTVPTSPSGYRRTPCPRIRAKWPSTSSKTVTIRSMPMPHSATLL